MVVEYPGNAIPAAGINRGGYIADDELLYSTAGFTQKGVRLKAGQGVLYLGTVLARETSTKKYVKFVAGGTGGKGEPVGILRKTVNTGTDADGQEYMGNIVIQGILKLDKVSYANGGTTAIQTGFLENATVNAVLGTFKF